MDNNQLTYASIELQITNYKFLDGDPLLSSQSWNIHLPIGIV